MVRMSLKSKMNNVTDIFTSKTSPQYATTWASKAATSGKMTKLNGWTPIRLSGRLRFKKKASKSEDQENNNNKNNTGGRGGEGGGGKRVFSRKGIFPGCAHQFHEYCQHTSLHGFRYVTEEKRAISERIFWICWCIFGISSAGYMMSKIWQRWQSNPVLTSIATTNLPVSAINFPAVTICTVNKAVSEKLIIQGCRLKYNFTEMRQIISMLVDPESRNNEYEVEDKKIKVDPKEALRMLRLVAPKCSDFILMCELNGQKTACNELFKLVLTDTGYCCTFNAMDTKNKVLNVRNDTEIDQQEREYDDLQKVVWNFTDDHHSEFGRPVEPDVNTTIVQTDARTCQRTYTDDLMYVRDRELCRTLEMCRRKPEHCGFKKPNETVTEPPPTLGSTSTTSTPGKNGSHLFRAAGAGRTRGLTIMTDTLRCAEVPTDSFKGLRIYVHGPDEFPAVGEKGFLVGPGQETQIGVTAIDTYSVEALKNMRLENRMCRFANEFPLKYYKEYSRSSCVIQCEHEYILKQCGCVPFYSPAAVHVQNSVCSREKMLDCVKKAMDNVQQLKGSATPTQPSLSDPQFSFGPNENQNNLKTCPEQCMPGCNETFYNIVVSAAQFPNQKEPNKTRFLKEAIDAGSEFLTNIDYVSGSISLLRIFFRESTIMQYKRDELFTWEDFVSNLGGVMSLCLGFSLLSLIEVIYFFTMRQINDMKRFKEDQVEKSTTY